MSEGIAPNPVVFDLETLRGPDECGGWGNAHAFGLAVAVTWCPIDGFRDWREPEAAALVAYLEQHAPVVGFNSLRFDYRVLSAYAPDVERRLAARTLDLLASLHAVLGFRVSLDHVCRETLAAGKSGSGADAPRWWAQGREADVIRYCRDDVALTRDLYLFGQRHGHVRVRSRGAARIAQVRWGTFAGDPAPGPDKFAR